MKERILKFLTQEGLSATHFADEIGVQRSSISHILSGRNNPGYDFIQKMLNRYRNINAEWLILGNGTMFKRESVPEITNEQSSISKPANDLFTITSRLDTHLNPADKVEIKNIITEKIEISDSKEVKKIVIFYSDKTFEEFLPSK